MNSTHILVEFKGGDYDGRIWDGSSTDEVVLEMLRDFLFFTNGGEIGKGFPTIPMNLYEAIRRKEISLADIRKSSTQKGVHVYRITNRVEIGEALLIRVEYSASMFTQNHPNRE